MYYGVWSFNSKITNYSDSNNLKIFIDYNFFSFIDDSNCKIYRATLNFGATKLFRLKKNTNYYGFINQKNNSYYFLNVQQSELTDICNILTNQDSFKGVDKKVREKLNESSIKFFDSLTLFLMEMKIPKKDNFILPVGIEGIFHSNLFSSSVLKEEFLELKIHGYKFNLVEYLKCAKVFGVISSIFFIILFYGWLSVFRNQTVANLKQMSLTSYMINMCFDFSYSVNLNDLFQFEGLFSLYFVLSTCLMGFYIFFQMMLVINIWRASYEDNDGIQFQFRFLIIMPLVMITMKTTFTSSILSLFLLYSSFIPQIILSVKQNSQKNYDTIFTIFVGINHLHFLIYFFILPGNIAQTHSSSAIYVLIYYIVQIIIILLQNKYGGAFFLPKRFHPHNMISYDYICHHVEPDTECSICITNIDDNDEIMKTPCNHFFHKECLTRWMEENMVCPLCRNSLPIPA